MSSTLNPIRERRYFFVSSASMATIGGDQGNHLVNMGMMLLGGELGLALLYVGPGQEYSCCLHLPLFFLSCLPLSP